MSGTDNSHVMTDKIIKENAQLSTDLGEKDKKLN